METVKGPTPPGTGVLKLHTYFAYYDISPLNFPNSFRLIPISIAIQPGFNFVIKLGIPTADMTISAYSVYLLKF